MAKAWSNLGQRAQLTTGEYGRQKGGVPGVVKNTIGIAKGTAGNAVGAGAPNAPKRVLKISKKR